MLVTAISKIPFWKENFYHLNSLDRSDGESIFGVAVFFIPNLPLIFAAPEKSISLHAGSPLKVTI